MKEVISRKFQDESFGVGKDEDHSRTRRKRSKVIFLSMAMSSYDLLGWFSLEAAITIRRCGVVARQVVIVTESIVMQIGGHTQRLQWKIMATITQHWRGLTAREAGIPYTQYSVEC